MTSADTAGEVGARRKRSASLATRLLFASAAAAALVAGAFGVLLVAINDLRDANDEESRTRQTIVSTLAVQKLMLDIQSGERGFVITGNEAFLQPWRDAQGHLSAEIEKWVALASHNPSQRKLALKIKDDALSYVDAYSAPLIDIARTNLAAARDEVATAEGRRQQRMLRDGFARFLRAEETAAGREAMAAADQSDRAIALAGLGLLASATLIALFGLYLTRSIGRPLREVASGATELAQGDLSVRLREQGPGEMRELTHAFNIMAERLERGRRELEEQNARLRESEELKSELVSIVSHEVRTPLASVLGFTSLLLQRDLDPETRRRYLEIVDGQARRLAALLDDFLDVQRIEEGRLDLGHERVDVAALLREQTQLFTALSDKHTVELALADPALEVRGDANRLAQVIGNLLSNAIKYSPAGGPVEVVGEQSDGAVRVSVRDRGLGIPADQQEQIFTKFFRGDAAASGITGTGLGLAFARAVVEAHGGQIDFMSVAGRGSTFWVELPTADAAAGTVSSTAKGGGNASLARGLRDPG
jgi:signal transduction histidine kinase